MPHRGLFLTCLLLIAVVTSGGVLAADGFSVTTESAVDVPERTVTNSQTASTFTVSQVGVIAPGEPIIIDSTAPDNSSYFLFFRDSDGNLVTRTSEFKESQPVELNLSAEPAGSYVVTIGPDSTPKDIIPVIIESYHVSSVSIEANGSRVSIDDTAINSTDSPKITVQLSQQADEPITSVNLTLWTKERGTIETVPLSADEPGGDDNLYRGSLPELDPGEYNLQVRIRGGNEVNNRDELIGLSDNRRLTVTDPPNENTGPEDSSPPGDDSGSDDTQSGGTTDDDDQTTDGDSSSGTTGNGTPSDSSPPSAKDDTASETDFDNTANGTDTGDTTNGTDTSVNKSTDNGTNTDSQDSNQADGTPNDSDGVINPNTPNDAPNTSESVPVRALPHLLLFVVVIAVVRRL